MRKITSRIISTCLALLLALTSLASMVQPAAAQETDLPSYDVQTFYNGLAPDESEQGTIVEIDQVGNLWQYGYYNDTVGYQLFNNLFYDENLWQMTQDAPSANAANWDYGDYALPGRYIYPAASYDSAVTFNAPMDGTVMLASTGAWVGGGSEDGVRIVIYAGNTKIWPTDSEWCDINSSNSNSVTVPEITVALHEGEQLHFRINCNGNTSGDMTCWYPTITYISSEYQNQYAPGAEEPEETLPVYSVKDGYTTPSDAAESEVVSINQADNTWQFGSYSSEEGYRLFNTQYYSDGQWRMTMDSTGGANWDYGAYALDNNIYPAGSRDNAVTFTAPQEGTVSVTAQDNVAWVGGATTDGIQIAVYAGDIRIWPTDSEWCVIDQETNGNCATIPEIKVAVHKGDELHFRINCKGSSQNDNTCWYPVITYISLEYQGQYAPKAEEPEETLPVYSVKDGYTTPSDAAESEVVSINQADNIWQFGSYSSEEGYQLFNTQYYSDGQWRMTMDSTGGANWDYGAYALDNNIYPAGSRDNAVTFTAPQEGTVSVTAQDNVAWVGGATTDGVQIAVYAGDIRIWPADSEWCVIDQETNGNCATIPEIKVAVHKGDELHFRINCKGSSQNDNTCWYPVITYVSKDYQSEYAPSGSETMPIYDVKNSYPGFEVDAANSPITIDQTGKIWQFGYYNPTDGYALFDSLYYEENDWRMTKNSNGGTNWDYGRYSLEFICPSGSSDGVYFQVTITLHKGAKDVVMHDKMEDVLDFNAFAGVEIDGLTEDEEFTVEVDDVEDDCDFEIHFTQTYLDSLTGDTTLTVTYEAVLNENADITDGEKNDAKLTWGDASNTEWSETVTKTYQFQVLKYDANDETKAPLAGATFHLKDADGNVVYLKDTSPADKPGTEYTVVPSPDDTGIDTFDLDVAVDRFTTVSDSAITIKGVDLDDYTLVEIEAPAGYNKLDKDKEFTVTADQIVVVEIPNNSGTELPSTGGIGTTIFYIFGSILVVGAAVLLITKKRMSVNG